MGSAANARQQTVRRRQIAQTHGRAVTHAAAIRDLYLAHNAVSGALIVLYFRVHHALLDLI